MMLDCRRCKEYCGRKDDLTRGLELISNYVSQSCLEEVEELIQHGMGKCDDFKE